MQSVELLTLVEKLKSLEERIEGALKKVAPPQQPYTSEEVDELYEALALSQSTLPPLMNNKKNPWFDSSYVEIFEISRTLYPTLGEHGLSITQQTRVTDEGATVLYTRLGHSSGQWMESRLRVIPPKNDIDSFRSTLNALRSTSLLSILGVGIQGDMLDDDGEIAMVEARGAFAKAPVAKNVDAKKEDSQVITKEQREELEYEMAEYTDLADEMLERCHVRSLADIPKSQFRNAISFIRRNKKAREGK